MTGAEYIVDVITQMGTTDVFGIPGAVILDFLYACESHPEIEPHLNYHEQMASYAAIGYAQASGNLGVAYSTRGPGVANMITAITESYFESVAVLFLTAHTSHDKSKQRFVTDQEVDFTESLKPFCKLSKRIDTVSELKEVLPAACKLAVSGRRGPVFIDIDTKLFKQEVEKDFIEPDSSEEITSKLKVIAEKLKVAKRPIILVGDGVRNANAYNEIEEFAINNDLPILSSRGAQDIFAKSKMYYGYIGSHGIRYSNFILSKADLIISLGNRLSFPIASKSYKSIYENAVIIRIDTDEYELERDIPNSMPVHADICDVKHEIKCIDVIKNKDWIKCCNTLKEQLNEEDIADNASIIADFLKQIDEDVSIVSDVGNNEFWVSRAYEFVHPNTALFFSKSYGTLGVGIGKAIGVYYASHRPVICFVGDQGFQYNSQEMQFISHWQLPITIVVLNNNCSAMIRDKELQKYDHAIHTTKETGYSTPDFSLLADAYGVKYMELSLGDKVKCDFHEPMLIEMRLDPDERLVPSLPIGKPCQDMYPELDREKYSKLNNL